MEAGKNNDCMGFYSVVFYSLCFPFKACMVVVGSADYLITCLTMWDTVFNVYKRGHRMVSEV
jgi:hypothetical protein